MQYPSMGSTRSRSFNNHLVSGAVSAANEPAEALIGRKVWTKWPEDNSFYEAVVTHYNAVEVNFLWLRVRDFSSLINSLLWFSS